MEDSQRIYSLVGTTAGKPVSVAVSADGLTIGRSHDSGLVVLDELVSRVHCVVRVQGDSVTVEDRSQNGTFVNGERISGTRELKPGDVLKVGISKFTLKKDEIPAATVVVTPAPAPAAAPMSAPATGPTPVQPTGPTESPSAPPAEPAVLKPGDMVDRYRIDRLVGKGGMGTVYAVTHTGLDLPRALKALTLPDGHSYAAFRDKFLDEGKMLTRLQHENITQVYDATYDEKTRTLFFVMDLVLYDDGRPCTLADVAYDECDVDSWFSSLASALDYIHAQGIVHSDIKLQNVLVSSGQKIKLADFGVAHLLSGKMRASLRGEAGAESEKMIGFTAHYVSPEILNDNALPSVASDVYALGVMLVKLLTGKWYDECPTVLAEIAAKRAMNWRPVLAQMLAADPKKRPTKLVPLVTQLRHGTKTPVRRKYLIESRRRRNQKVRLVRAAAGKTVGMGTTTFAPESSKASKIVLWSVVAAVAAAIAGGGIWMSRANAAAQAEEAAREERLSDTKSKVGIPIQKAGVALEAQARQAVANHDRYRQEYGFVEDLSYANVTGTTDKAMADLRNDALVRYGDVLRAAGAVRAAAQNCRVLYAPYLERVRDCVRIEDLTPIAGAFKDEHLKAEAALVAACEAERTAWSAYEEAKPRIGQVGEARSRFREARSRNVALIRQMLEGNAELKTIPERTAAAAKLAEGDRFATAVPADPDAAVACYANAVACVSNGWLRLLAEREERTAVEEGFRKADDELRNVLLPNFRHGKTSLAIIARHANELYDRYNAKWADGCKDPSNRVKAAEYACGLEAPAAYFAYLAKALPGRRNGLAYKLTSNGVEVNNGRFPYALGWNDIFSTKKLDMKAKENYRWRILDLFDEPGKKPNARRLLGRWIALKCLMPNLNDDGAADRLVEAVRADGGAAILACTRRELPERFVVKPTAVEVAEAETNQMEGNRSETGEAVPEASGSPDEKSEESESAESKPNETKSDDGKSDEDKSEDEELEVESKTDASRDGGSGKAEAASADESANGDAESAQEKAEPADTYADFPETLPEQSVDLSQERLIFFHPLQGLRVEAFGREGVEIGRCQRIRDTRRVRFELREGVVFAGGAGARQTHVDIGEGESFNAGNYDDEQACCRYGLVFWIDDALGDGRPLVLVRCQKISQ